MCFKQTVAQVTVELKNDLAIQGTLHSVDQYLNIKLHNTRVVNEQKYPHMVSVKQTAPLSNTHLVLTDALTGALLQMSVRNCFIRGSVVRYVQVRALNGTSITTLASVSPAQSRKAGSSCRPVLCVQDLKSECKPEEIC